MKKTNGKLWKTGTLVYSSTGLAMLFFWLLWGDFTWAMKDRAVGPSATLLIKQIGVSDFLYALIVIAFPCSTNIFLSPIISYLSDRHRGPHGRRIPFSVVHHPLHRAGAVRAGPHSASGRKTPRTLPRPHFARRKTAGLLHLLGDSGLRHHAGRNALQRAGQRCSAAGASRQVLRLVPHDQPRGGNSLQLFLLKEVEHYVLWIFVGIGTLYGVGLFSLCFNVKEGEYPPPEQPEQQKNQTAVASILSVWQAALNYLRQSFSLGYYRKIMLAQTLLTLSFSPVNSFSILYAGKLGIGMERYGLYIAVTYACSFFLSYFLGILADRFNPLRTGMSCLGLYAALMILGWVLLGNPAAFGPILILHGVVSGSCMTLTASLPQRLFPVNCSPSSPPPPESSPRSPPCCWFPSSAECSIC
ncbi:MAG: MFS transporter [Lentisphaeria bacterium]|nr:MAG: MFS transporter [Lentisphaeria bacterium]